MRIEHIAMYVNDLEKTKEFFIQYFHAKANDGYHNKTTDFRSYFLSFDDGARLEIMNKPEIKNMDKDINRTGFIHVAFSGNFVDCRLCYWNAKGCRCGFDVTSVRGALYR